MKPSTWLASVIDTLRTQNKALPFKIISTHLNVSVGTVHKDVVRVLDQNDGSVWRFECCVERGPA